MNDYIKVFADESETSPFDGVFSGWQGIAGIVLFVVGILMIYIGIKVLQGYRIMPETETVPLEDNYVPTKAKVLQKVKTTMPDFNGGGERVIVEWKIGYEIDGEKYKQIVPDSNYEKGEILDIMYNPDNPAKYYLADEKSQVIVEKTQQDEPEKEEKSPAGYVIIALAVMIMVIAVVLII